MSITCASVIGAGQMGLGIAYVAARYARIPVSLHDPSPSVLSAALKRLNGWLARDVDKGRLDNAQAEAVRARVAGVEGSARGLIGADDGGVIIEAIPENVELKTSLFKRLGQECSPTTVLGSNTSSISLTRLAGAAGAASARVVGIHFFNPVPQMKLVEIIPALQTDPGIVDRAKAFGRACGKEVVTSSDSPGFIANAILMPMLNEAVFLLERGVASKEDIDTTFRLGMGHPMGPLALADLIGLDTCLAIQRVLYTEMGDSKYRPAGLLVKMVDAGRLGKKVGRGFYEYDE
ncbi:hypothetical protein Q5752_000204 [Cryptotrichosporon argae]